MAMCLRKGIALLIAFTLLAAGLLAIPSFAVYAAPDDGGRVPYRYSFDKIHTKSHSDTRLVVLRDLELELGQPLEAAGWLATDEGVSAYQYLWIPAGGGVGEWITLTDARISPRPDLEGAGIPYVSGHGTAGFTFSIEPPEGTADGYYDVYVRALDGMGTPCDLAVLLGLRYGEPDVVTVGAHRISFSRVLREGEASLFGGATVTEEAIILPPDGGVKLGHFNLAGFEAVKITYEALNPEAPGKTPVLGLKSAGTYSYGKGSEGYNLTDDLAYTPISLSQSEILLDLSGCDDYGDLWLTGHLNADLRITKVEFVCNGYGTDRVAAKVYLSEELISSYFTSYNYTDLKPLTDPVLGDVLRMEVKEDTNDPFVFFHAGKLLKDRDVVLDAGEYKYMVFLYRAGTANNTTRMNLYLCAGNITGATEACNQGVALQNDGKWHYLLVDLTQRENWDGIINGWRFDYISGNSDAGDYVDFASVQFFRTEKAAKAAAGQDPAKGTAFHTGDPFMIKDLCEEQGQESNGDIPTIDPADTYVVTEPATEPPAEPPTNPTDETQAPSPTPEDTTSAPTETEPAGKGCRGALVIPVVLPVLSIPAILLSKRETNNCKKEKRYA